VKATSQLALKRGWRQWATKLAVATHATNYLTLTVSSPTIEFGLMDWGKRHLVNSQ
jgi:hypothetical protein